LTNSPWTACPSLDLSPLFLGLDASTQSFKASLSTSKLEVRSELAVNFDIDLPLYQTSGGVLHGPEVSGELFSPVMSVVKALDLLFERIKVATWRIEHVKGIDTARARQVNLAASATRA